MITKGALILCPLYLRLIMKNNIEWIVKKVIPQKDFTLLITFADNSMRLFDMKPLLDKPVFKPLNNIGFFMLAKVQYGTVVWNDDIDIAPEHLYECSVPVTE